MYGDDGIPFTGDPNEVTACTTLVPGYYPDVDPFCDPRTDDLLEREGTVDDSFGFFVFAGFDVTRMFRIALDAAWYRSDVGPIDVYSAETYPFFFQNNVIALQDRDFSEPIGAGELTQIPITLTGLVRFRTDSDFRPYVGVGGGVILTEFERDEDVDALVDRLETLRIRGFANEKGRNVTPVESQSDFEFNGGRLRFGDDVTIEAEDAWEWHLTAGLEYAINPRFSLTFDARYLFADQEVSITIMGEDQLDIFTWPDEIFHPNGALAVFSAAGVAPNPFCIETAGRGYGCGGAPAGKRVTPSEGPNGNGVNGPPFTCPGRADFDANGTRDWCYRSDLKSPLGRDILGMWVVQGGTIELSGWAFGIGMRVHI